MISSRFVWVNVIAIFISWLIIYKLFHWLAESLFEMSKANFVVSGQSHFGSTKDHNFISPECSVINCSYHQARLMRGRWVQRDGFCVIYYSKIKDFGQETWLYLWISLLINWRQNRIQGDSICKYFTEAFIMHFSNSPKHSPVFPSLSILPHIISWCALSRYVRYVPLEWFLLSQFNVQHLCTISYLEIY